MRLIVHKKHALSLLLFSLTVSLVHFCSGGGESAEEAKSDETTRQDPSSATLKSLSSRINLLERSLNSQLSKMDTLLETRRTEHETLKSHPYASVLDHGSLGDQSGATIKQSDIDASSWIGTYEVGDTWDYVGIQEAIYHNLHKSRTGIVMINAGNYILNKPVIIPSGMHVVGEGYNTTIFVQGASGFELNCGSSTFGSGYRLARLRIVPNKAEIDCAIGAIAGSGKSLVSVELDNLKVDAQSVGGVKHVFKNGIVLDGVRKGYLNNVNVRASENAVLSTNDTAETNILNSYFISTTLGKNADNCGIRTATGAKHTEGIIVKNSLIYGFTVGVLLKDCLAGKVVDNYIDLVSFTDTGEFQSAGVILENSMRSTVRGNWIKSHRTGVQVVANRSPAILSYLINANTFDACGIGVDVGNNNQGLVVASNIVTGGARIGFRFQTNSGNNVVSNNLIEASLLELDFGYGSVKNQIRGNLPLSNRVRILEKDNVYD